MKMLLEHVDAFFKDIISETQEREKAIRERIDSKFNNVWQCFLAKKTPSGLIREKQDLKRLLKEDANEVTKDVPLHTLQMNIDESLKELREKLKARHEEIAMLLSDQEELCNGEKCSVQD